MLRRLFPGLLLLLCFAPALAAQGDPAYPYEASQPGYFRATLELARFCFEQGLYAEGRKLKAQIVREGRGSPEAEDAQALGKDIAADKADNYSAKAWGEYLDRREAIGARRGEAAFKALGESGAHHVLRLDPGNADARKVLGHLWLDGLGWLEQGEATRLKPLCVKLKEAGEKPPHEATWSKPYVIVAQYFTLQTDLPWARALKYARLLDRYHEAFVEKLGDVIPIRKAPNRVYCCKDAKTFVAFSNECRLNFTDLHSGMYVQHLGAVVINAERCDFVGKKNGSKDNLARTFYHECTHRLVDIGLRGLRDDERMMAFASREHAWIVEGVAIVFEALEIKDKGHTLKGLEFQRTYTIDKHFKPKKKVPDAKAVLLQGHIAFAQETPVSSAEKYAIAGSVAWYCLFHKPKEYRAAFLGLLVDYYRADTACRDFKARFGLGLDDFIKEWTPYVLK